MYMLNVKGEVIAVYTYEITKITDLLYGEVVNKINKHDHSCKTLYVFAKYHMKGDVLHCIPMELQEPWICDYCSFVG